MAGRDKFIDPATENSYEWEVNHSYEGDEGNAKKRSITETANTGNVGLVKQQCSAEGMVLKRSGAFFTLNQEEEFWYWFQLCQSQTIYFEEFDGSKFEVQIVNYDPRRIGTSGLSKNGKGYYVKWTMEMIVYAVLAGPMTGVEP